MRQKTQLPPATRAQIEANLRAGKSLEYCARQADVSIRQVRNVQAATIGGKTPDGVTKRPQLATSVDVLSQSAAPVGVTEIAQIVAETLQRLGLIPEPPKSAPAIVAAPVIQPKARTLIFTAWEVRVKPDPAFVDCLRQMAHQYGAELFLVPVWPEDLRYLPRGLDDFQIVTGDFTINENLRFQYVPTHALVQSPIEGWKGAFNESRIIPGLIRDLITVPSQHLCKQVMSTGSIGRLNADLKDYSHLEKDEALRKAFTQRWAKVTNRRGGRAYALAQQYTVPSALVVDLIDHKTFTTRYVAMQNEQDFVYDLNLKFTAGQQNPAPSRPAALNTGDWHIWEKDEGSTAATYEMISHFNPAEVIVNDYFDGASVNRHTTGQPGYFSGQPSINQEAAATIRELTKLCNVAEAVTYLHSNHDDFLTAYLDRPDLWRLNNNYRTCLALENARLADGKHPIRSLLGLDAFANLRFVDDRDSHYAADVLIKHGHEGQSGARTGFRGLAKIYGKYSQAHTHSPGVFRNAVNVGTNSILNPRYVRGASGWLGANSLIQPDSSQQLLPIIEGKWRQ